MPSKLRNTYSHKNHEVHLEWPLAFKRAAKLHCPSNICLPFICHHASYCIWPRSLNSELKHEDDTDQEIGDDKRKDTGQFAVSCDCEEEDLHNQQEVSLRSLVHWDKSFWTIGVPPPRNWNSTDTTTGRPVFKYWQYPAAEMELPLPKCQKSTLLNKLFQSDCAPSSHALPLYMSSGDLNVQLLKASREQNIPQCQITTGEVANWLMEAIIFMRTPSPILSDEKYWMANVAWKLTIEAQDCRQAFAGA